MDNVISFTPAQLLSLILGVCGAIITISAAIGIITKVIEKAKTPEREQDDRIQALEEIVKQYGETLETFRTYFANDDTPSVKCRRKKPLTFPEIPLIIEIEIAKGESGCGT